MASNVLQTLGCNSVSLKELLSYRGRESFSGRLTACLPASSLPPCPGARGIPRTELASLINSSKLLSCSTLGSCYTCRPHHKRWLRLPQPKEVFSSPLLSRSLLCPFILIMFVFSDQSSLFGRSLSGC